MLAKVVSYGGNSVRYALEKENAKTVKVNNMPDGLDPTAIWYMMKHHCQYHQAERTVGRKLERFMTTLYFPHQRRNLPTSRWKIGQTSKTKHWEFWILLDFRPTVSPMK